ncbi:MAG: lytic transglycosylase domain-containing protein [Spirochaetes bacterium]|nr:lytic transglycosylase domain-containing protein [Spirochaetota bacterium]
MTHKLKRYLPAGVACCLAVSLALPSPAPAKVYKRVNPDGSIELYNKNEGRRSKASGASRSISSKFDELIETVSARHGMDSRLIKCIIKIESDFNPEAVSPAGAMGLMQLMQETADYYFLENPFDPEKNIDTGVRHFKSLYDYFKNDIPLALAAYHAGLGRVKKNMSLPPIQSTIDYVNAVMHLYTGKKDRYSATAVRRLYKRIEKDGTIVIYSK